jgi:hypothetical protein
MTTLIVIASEIALTHLFFSFFNSSVADLLLDLFFPSTVTPSSRSALRTSPLPLFQHASSIGSNSCKIHVQIRSSLWAAPTSPLLWLARQLPKIFRLSSKRSSVLCPGRFPETSRASQVKCPGLLSSDILSSSPLSPQNPRPRRHVSRRHLPTKRPLLPPLDLNKRSLHTTSHVRAMLINRQLRRHILIISPQFVWLLRFHCYSKWCPISR